MSEIDREHPEIRREVDEMNDDLVEGLREWAKAYNEFVASLTRWQRFRLRRILRQPR